MSTTHLVTETDLENRLAEHLRRLELPDCFLYTGLTGAGNWLALDGSAQFPVATRLTSLLRDSADEVAAALPAAAMLFSVGTGDGAKERLLLEAMVAGGARPRYVAVDVSARLVGEALGRVADLGVDAHGVVGLCEQADELSRLWRSPVVVALLGNNVSNYDPDRLLPELRRRLGVDDRLLIDAHLLPADPSAEARWRRETEAAYRSPANVRFNLGPLLDHGARTDQCRFALELNTTETVAGPALRTRKWIEMLEAVRLRIGGRCVCLAAGDVIEMGTTYKYTAGQLEWLLEAHGFGVERRFPDAGGENLLVLARPTGGNR